MLVGGVMLMGIWIFVMTGLYALTLRPSIAWSDSPEFVTIAHTLGIAHPPGSPTYAMLGKIATYLPLGSIAVRTSLLSALCGAGTLALVASAVAHTNERLGGTRTPGRIGGILAATLLGVAPTWWNFCTQTEVYVPFAFAMALMLYLALRWEASLDERCLLGGAFLFGISGGLHGTSLFFFPAFAILVLHRIPRERMAKSLVRVALLGLLGASIFLYLPVRAGAEPSINWGHPDTFSRFWELITDRKDEAVHFEAVSRPVGPYLSIFARNLKSEFTALGLTFGLIGLTLLLIRMPRIAIFTLALALGNVLFFLRIWTIPDAYLPAFVVLTFWTGVSVAWGLGARWGRWNRWGRGAVTAVLLVAIGVQAWKGGRQAGYRTTDAPRSVAENNLLPLPEDAIAFVTVNWFPMRYLQDVEGMRPDVTILLASDLMVPDQFNPVTQQRFPRLRFPPMVPESHRWDDYFRRVLSENVGRAPIYWEPLSFLSGNVGVYLRPWRYLWRFDSKPIERLSPTEAAEYLDELRAFLKSEFTMGGVRGDPEAVRYHAYHLRACAEALEILKRPQEAAVLFELVLRIEGETGLVLNDLGRVYTKVGRTRDAYRMFRRAQTISPGNPVPILNRAMLDMSRGRLSEARSSIEQALSIDRSVPDTWYQLSVLERKTGRSAQARDALRRALELSGNKQDRKLWKSELDGLSVDTAP